MFARADSTSCRFLIPASDLVRVLVQRVTSASVTVNDQVVGAIDSGLLLLVGFGKGDTEETLQPMAHKIVHLRIFAGHNGRFQYSVLEMNGGILTVPQFTLYGDVRRGRRPEFVDALAPKLAQALFDRFVEVLRATGVTPIESGQFGAAMQVQSLNDGPVTLMLERQPGL